MVNVQRQKLDSNFQDFSPMERESCLHSGIGVLGTKRIIINHEKDRRMQRALRNRN